MRATGSEHASAEPQTAGGRRSALDRRGRGFVAAFLVFGVLVIATTTVSSSTGSETAEPTQPTPIKPATGGTPSAAEAPYGLAIPTGEPLLVGSGSTDGAWWALSLSIDGRCLALTDERGSTRKCAPRRGQRRGKLIGVRRLSGSLLVFGRVPGDAVALEISTGRNDDIDDGVIFPTPAGVDPAHPWYPHRFFVGSINGYRNGVVPRGVVWALGTDNLILHGGVEEAMGIPLPWWAERPRAPIVATIATGNGAPTGPAISQQEAPIGRWRVAIFREEGTGRLCLGIVGNSVCGPTAHPLAAWARALSQPLVSLDPPPLTGLVVLDGGMNGGGSPYENWFTVGFIRDPIVAVRARFTDGRPPIRARLYELPWPYRGALTVYAIECACPSGVHLEGIDASGRVVARTGEQ